MSYVLACAEMYDINMHEFASECITQKAERDMRSWRAVKVCCKKSNLHTCTSWNKMYIDYPGKHLLEMCRKFHEILPIKKSGNCFLRSG